MKSREPIRAIILLLLLLPSLGLYFSLLSGLLWISVALFSLIAIGMLLAVFLS